MEKVYIVEASSGSYDDYAWWIHGIYLTSEEAEQSKNKLNAEWEAKKNILPPFPVDKDGDLIDENLSPEEKKIYHIWWRDNFYSEEWNGAKVKEYEIGKIFKN